MLTVSWPLAMANWRGTGARADREGGRPADERVWATRISVSDGEPATLDEGEGIHDPTGSLAAVFGSLDCLAAGV